MSSASRPDFQDPLYMRSANRAFNEAVEFGHFTHKDAAEWMYMYTGNGVDWFKHIETRKYIAVEIRDGHLFR